MIRRLVSTLAAVRGDAHRQIHRTVRAGCPEDHFRRLRCPKCQGPLALAVTSDCRTFFVYCTQSTLHLAMHGESKSPPPWWTQHISNEWLD